RGRAVEGLVGPALERGKQRLPRQQRVEPGDPGGVEDVVGGRIAAGQGAHTGAGAFEREAQEVQVALARGGVEALTFEGPRAVIDAGHLVPQRQRIARPQQLGGAERGLVPTLGGRRQIGLELGDPLLKRLPSLTIRTPARHPPRDRQAVATETGLQSRLPLDPEPRRFRLGPEALGQGAGRELLNPAQTWGGTLRGALPGLAEGMKDGFPGEGGGSERTGSGW